MALFLTECKKKCSFTCVCAFFVVPSNICLLFYVCANPPSGDLSGAALEVPSEALLHPRSYVRTMQPILQTLTLYL